MPQIVEGAERYVDTFETNDLLYLQEVYSSVMIDSQHYSYNLNLLLFCNPTISPRTSLGLNP